VTKPGLQLTVDEGVRIWSLDAETATGERDAVHHDGRSHTMNNIGA
jgi:hypothetical protein